MDFHLDRPRLDSESQVPIYRQVAAWLREAINHGRLAPGARIPPSREMAAWLGLNRTTISSAYSLLESEGLLAGRVGRGSYVAGQGVTPRKKGLDWSELVGLPEVMPPAPASDGGIDFSTSRPSAELFPLEHIRECCAQVLADDRAGEILQLGSPGGYPPLRRHLLELAQRLGMARKDEDDVIITNGCQQALDLLHRVLFPPGEQAAVVIEDPVYPGLKNVFTQPGTKIAGVAVTEAGLDIADLEQTVDRERPRAIIVTSDFQNPTGTTLDRAARRAVLRVAREARALVIENGIYAELRYQGAELESIKALDSEGGTVRLDSFSKMAFPGLRVGWVLGPRPLLARLAEAKRWCDLHTDQLAQAVLLRFSQSGRLDDHCRRASLESGLRLRTVLKACETHLPPGTRFTRPEGGMNIWVSLPGPLDASELLAAAQRAGVIYMPGKYFAVSRPQAGSLRLSFAGVEPERIEAGVAALGRVFRRELEAMNRRGPLDPTPAVV